jgi:aryl-alcohol dehydrogenase-like predicted oxidoreductase
VLARLPLASGLLTGKMKSHTKFEVDDHRAFNRLGEAFDRGETFSGVDYDLGLDVVERLRVLVPKGATMAQWALAWILQNEAVTCVIPGARRPDQAAENAAAADLPPLSVESMTAAQAMYERTIKPKVHQYW